MMGQQRSLEEEHVSTTTAALITLIAFSVNVPLM